MPIANSEDKDQGLPVVSQGEDLQVWLKRAVPALVEMGTPEDQALELATEAWNRVNGQDKFARSDKPATPEIDDAEAKPAAAPKKEPPPFAKPAEDKPEPKAEDEKPKPAADKPAQDAPRTEQPKPDAEQPAQDAPRDGKPEPEAEGEMTWDRETWGGLSDADMEAAQSKEGDAPATEDTEGAEQADEDLDDDNYAALQPAREGDIGGWYTGQIMNFAQALGAHLLDNGLVDDEQLTLMVSAVMEMAAGLESDLAQRLAPPKETKFTYDVALPDFARKGGPGSGYHEPHVGLPGVHGGSQSREEAGYAAYVYEKQKYGKKPKQPAGKPTDPKDLPKKYPKGTPESTSAAAQSDTETSRKPATKRPVTRRTSTYELPRRPQDADAKDVIAAVERGDLDPSEAVEWVNDYISATKTPVENVLTEDQFRALIQAGRELEGDSDVPGMNRFDSYTNATILFWDTKDNGQLGNLVVASPLNRVLLEEYKPDVQEVAKLLVQEHQSLSLFQAIDKPEDLFSWVDDDTWEAYVENVSDVKELPKILADVVAHTGNMNESDVNSFVTGKVAAAITNNRQKDPGMAQGGLFDATRPKSAISRQAKRYQDIVSQSRQRLARTIAGLKPGDQVYIPPITDEEYNGRGYLLHRSDRINGMNLEEVPDKLNYYRVGATATESAAQWATTKTVAGPQMPYVMKFPNVRSPLSDTLAIKALGRDRVGSYLCVWGNPNRKDLSGEYFTPRTQELTAIFDAIGTIPAIYHHALDNTVKSAVIGLVDVMKRDDVGLWIEAQVREHKAYKNLIKPLLDDHVLGWSSGALPGGRQVNKATGEITRWPIVEASMTPSPMEWRMAAQWPVQNIKAVYQQAGLPFNVVSKALRPKPPQASLDAEIAAELELLRILELS